MITIGVDAHKHLQVARALDDQGAILGDWHGPNSAAGWAGLHQWAITFGGVRQWGTIWGLELWPQLSSILSYARRTLL